MPSYQAGIPEGPPETVYPFFDAEMMPTWKRPALSTEKGDFFQ
jgi:hypothetical protein